MKPLVSILIPAFNAQKWIAETLQSAVAQTWQNTEVIVVDDGSTDQTLTIARRFESGSVRVVTQKNQGASAARNKALALSQGDYIQWLDADDLLGPDKVELQVKAAEQGRGPRMLISGPWGRFMHRYYRAQFVPSALWNDLSPADWLIRKMGLNLHMQTATWLASRELTEAAGPWDTQLLGDDDGEYFCRVLLASDGVLFVPDALVYYRAAPHSLSYIGSSEKKREMQWRSMKLHIGYLRSLEESERVRFACVQYIQNWLSNFYPERPDLVEQMQQAAAELGGKLEVPRLSWKYSWIQPIFGRNFANRVQHGLRLLKWSLVRSWDKLLFRLTDRGFTSNLCIRNQDSSSIPRPSSPSPGCTENT